MRKLIIVSETPNTTKPPNAAESEKTMSNQVHIVETLNARTEITQKQQVQTSIYPSFQWPTDGTWQEVQRASETTYLACFDGKLYKIEQEDSPETYDLEFVLGDTPEVALYRYGTLVESSGYDLPKELNRWQWEEESPNAMSILYGNEWRGVNDNTIYEAYQCREALVIWHDRELIDDDLYRAKTHYEAWSQGYMWRVYVAENVQIGKEVTHFTITPETIDALVWEHVTGGVIFTPDSSGWNEPNIPVQELL